MGRVSFLRTTVLRNDISTKRQMFSAGLCIYYVTLANGKGDGRERGRGEREKERVREEERVKAKEKKKKGKRGRESETVRQ